MVRGDSNDPTHPLGKRPRTIQTQLEVREHENGAYSTLFVNTTDRPGLLTGALPGTGPGILASCFRWHQLLAAASIVQGKLLLLLPVWFWLLADIAEVVNSNCRPAAYNPIDVNLSASTSLNARHNMLRRHCAGAEGHQPERGLRRG